MPYRKQYRKKRTQKRGGGTFNTAMDLARKAYNGYKMLKGLVNTEHKFLDTTGVAGAIPLTNTVNGLSLIAQGTNYNEREGISIKASSVQWRCKFSLGATPLPVTVRQIIFWDMECAGAFPSLADVLESTTIPTVSPLNHTNGRRFRIISDSCVQLSPNGDEQKYIEGYHKCSHHIKYGGTTNGIASCREGNLMLLLVSDTNVAASEPLADIFYRLRFVDN